jgi:tRNA A-37 threonylcarbamoyl transferase component Bud32
MPIEVRCTNPNCNKRHQVPSASAGKSVRCRACGETFIAAEAPTLIDPRTAYADEVLEPAWSTAPSASPAPVLPSHATLTSARVGRFVIRGKLGAGAFGTVYRAYDPQLDREVALKVPNPGVMADAKRAERFLREAKAAANLRHPHIVPVFDTGKDGDTFYIASAFIAGQPLSDTIEEHGTDFARAARIVRELAEALAYAHGQGIVHRDVKPQNVMVDRHDRVHLMDFGLAARHDEESRLTADGTVLGTAAYMAPEQAAGQKGEAQPSFDQYAVGVVLYELLTGTVPFKGPVPVVIHSHLHAEPAPPRTLRPEVPRDLETICLRALSKRPEDRYPNCQELADDLRRWLEGEPVTARRMGVAERVARWVRKEPKLAAAGALIALLVCAAVGLLVVSAERARQNAQTQDRLRREADTAAAQAEKDAAAARTAEKRAEESAEQAHTAGASAVVEAERARGALKSAEDERKQAESARAKTAEALKTAENEKHAAEDARKAAEGAKKAAEDARKQAETALSDLEKAQRSVAEAAYPSQIRAAAQLLELKSYHEANRVLDQCAKELRESEWRYLKFLCAAQGKSGFPYAAHPGNTKQWTLAALSTDGRRIAAYTTKSQSVALFDVRLGLGRTAAGPLELWGDLRNLFGDMDPNTPFRQLRVTGGAQGRDTTRAYLEWYQFRLNRVKEGDEKNWFLTMKSAGSSGLHCTEEGYVLAAVPKNSIIFSRTRHEPPVFEKPENGRTPEPQPTIWTGDRTYGLAVSPNGKWVALSTGWVYEVNWEKIEKQRPNKPALAKPDFDEPKAPRSDGDSTPKSKVSFLNWFNQRYVVRDAQVGALAVSSGGQVAFAEKTTAGVYISTPVEDPPIGVPAGPGAGPGVTGGPPGRNREPPIRVRDVPGKWTNVNLLRFSRDGRRLVFIEGAYGPIYLVDTASGALLMTLRVGGGVLDIGFDGETRSVMAVTTNGQLHVWYAFDPQSPGR